MTNHTTYTDPQTTQPQQQQQLISPLGGEFISNATRGVAPATFEFEANIEGGVEPYTINWDFDDGSGEDDEDTVVHTFDEVGSYTVTATVIDSVGQVGSGSMKITVEEPSSLPPASRRTQMRYLRFRYVYANSTRPRLLSEF